MVVLNFYGKIPTICLSKKLGLYISNLPDEAPNDWKECLVGSLNLAINADRILQEQCKWNFPCGIRELFQTLFPTEVIPTDFDKISLTRIADQMICIYQDYNYNDMPLGGWDTNCFDGRLCEEEYAEKIIDLINYLSYQGPNDPPSLLPEPVPQWVYSSNHDEIDHFRIFWGGEPADPYIEALKNWGSLFDNLLMRKNDYLLFDYLANIIHKDNEYNENHLMKAYSLCQLFLEKKWEGELDKKLPIFFYHIKSEAGKRRQAELFRQMRNKIAHGDFIAFEDVVETYAKEFMDGRFAFDYSECSRKNWTVQHVCCELDDVVRRLISMLLLDREGLNKIKNS